MGRESTFQELNKTVGFFEICFHSSNVKTVCKWVVNKKLLWKFPEPKGDLKKPTFSEDKTTKSFPLIALASCPRLVWSCHEAAQRPQPVCQMSPKDRREKTDAGERNFQAEFLRLTFYRGTLEGIQLIIFAYRNRKWRKEKGTKHSERQLRASRDRQFLWIAP